MTPRLAEAGLEPCFAAAGAEFEGAARARGLVVRQLRFGPHSVRLRFAGDELADVLLPAFADQRLDGHGVSLATISVWSERACVGDPGRFPWTGADIGPGGLVRGFDDGSVVAVHEPASRAITLVDRARQMLLHRVPEAGAVPWWERAAPLRSALFWALGGGGRHLVHAGAVGDDRGGVLVAGASGSGKTTVALAALTRGLGYLAEDYVLLDVTGEPTVFPIYGTAKLDGGHRRRFATLAGAVRLPPAPEAEQKAVLDVGRLAPDLLRESLPVRGVLLPRIRGARARLRRVSGGEALLALAPSTVLQQPFDDGAAVAALAGLVRRVPCFAMDVGDDVADIAATVEQALERVRS